MEILFSKNWNKSTIRNIIKNNCYLEFGRHEDLRALCVYPFEEDDDCSSDYYELAFIVPTKWLKETVNGMFNISDIDDWLQNEYTTDESELIFERALNERKVVMVDFD